MTETIVLLMLVVWLVCTLVMTVRAGRSRSQRTERLSAPHVTEGVLASPGAESDPRLASQP
jgi:hypothetical protein